MPYSFDGRDDGSSVCPNCLWGTIYEIEEIDRKAKLICSNHIHASVYGIAGSRECYFMMELGSSKNENYF